MKRKEDKTYTLTPWGCLMTTLLDYDIDLSYINGRIGTHIVDDFMEALMRCGYVSKVEKGGDTE